MTTPPCPVIEKALLDHLKAVFPEKVPEHEVSLFAVGSLSGEQRVIRTLEARFRDQQNTKANLTNVLKQT